MVEALLYAADDPVPAERIAEVIGAGRGNGARRAGEEAPPPRETGASGAGAADGVWGGTAAVDPMLVHSACQELEERLRASGSALQVVEVAGGYRLGTRPRFDPYIRALRKVERPARLSLPLLETLAVVAYRQPVTLAEITAIRGKDPASAMRRLRELGLVRVAGRRRTVGRPFTYGTTERFLELFGLRDLRELPAPEEFQELLEA